MSTSPLECIHGEGALQLGVCVWSDEAKYKCVDEKVETLVSVVKRLVIFARLFPQVAYTGMKMWLHKKISVFRRVTPSVGLLFEPLGVELRKYFLPTLLWGRR